MSSSRVTGPSAELIRYTPGSTRIGRTCRPCVTIMLSATRGSAHRPRKAGTGWLPCTKGNSSTSPEEESATGRPDRDPLATQDDPAKFLTQDSRTTGDGSARSTVEVIAEELGQACGGRRLPRPGPRAARASSQLDRRCDERDAG